MYNSMNKEYVRVPAVLGAAMMQSMGFQMPDESKLHTSYKTLREEPVEVDGIKHDCWVVEGRLAEMEVPAPQARQMRMKVTDDAWSIPGKIGRLWRSFRRRIRCRTLPLSAGNRAFWRRTESPPTPRSF